MTQFLNDLRFAARMLLKRPGFALLGVITIALGIGANTAIFSVVHASLLKPLPYPEPDELVFYWETNPNFGDMSISYLNYLDWRAQSQAMESMAVYRRDRFNLTSAGDPEQVRATMISANIFDTLGVTTLLGRDFTADEDRVGGDPVVILTHGYWQRRFGGDEAIIGRVITLDSRPYEVVGVMPEDQQRPTRSDLYVPIGQFADREGWESRDNHQGIYGYARLADGVTLEQAQAEIDTIAAGLAEAYPESNRANGVVYHRLSEYLVSNLRPALLLLTAAVVLVLLIACVNMANLLLARAAARDRELAVRAAVGAGRWAIARQLMTESLLLSLVGGAVGVALAYVSLDAVRAVYGTALPRPDDVSISLPVLGYSAALTLATGLLFGLVPALTGGGRRLLSPLQGGARAGQSVSQRRFQVGLAVTEIGLAVVLLVGAGLLLRSFGEVLDVDPGLDPDGVLTASISLPPARYDSDEKVVQFWRELEQEVAALPGVNRVGVTSNLPFIGGNQTSFSIAGRPVPEPGEFPNAEYAQVTPGYFGTIGMRLLTGRLLDDRDQPDAPMAMVIDQSFAETHWPGENPIGRQVVFGAGHGEHQLSVTVVGIVGTVRHNGLDVEPPRPQMYFPMAQRPETDDIRLVVKAAIPPENLVEPVRQAVLAVDPEQPITDARPYRTIVDDSLADRRLSMTLFGFFAAVAAVLALVGIYGVIAYGVTRRTQEIGVRMAMGASGRRILALVLRQVGFIGLIGVATGLAGAALLGRLMESQLFGVGAHDPLTFTLVPATLIGFALLACLLPARRAARTQPTEALRHE